MQTFYKTTTTKDFNNWLPTQNPSSCQVFANPLANWVFIESATIAFFFLFVFELTLYIPKCPRLLYRENENDDISYEWLKMHDIGLCVCLFYTFLLSAIQCAKYFEPFQADNKQIDANLFKCKWEKMAQNVNVIQRVAVGHLVRFTLHC